MKAAARVAGALLIAILALALALFGLPRLMGVQLYNVKTASMAPQYNVGDLVYVMPAQDVQIMAQDVICFAMGTGQTIVTHRVVEIDRQNGLYYTKGDANPARDPQGVSYQNIVGVVRFSLPFMGNILHALASTQGKILAVMLLVALAALSSVLDMFSKPRKRRKRAKA